MGPLNPVGADGVGTVFGVSGGFTLEAAESILELSQWPDAPWGLDVLESLLDHSLLHTRNTPSGLRFFMYRSIHDYSAKRLAEWGDSSGGVDTNPTCGVVWARVSPRTVPLSTASESGLHTSTGGVRQPHGRHHVWHPETATQCCIAVLQIAETSGPISLAVDLSRERQLTPIYRSPTENPSLSGMARCFIWSGGSPRRGRVFKRVKAYPLQTTRTTIY